jgi:hypothetical protein
MSRRYETVGRERTEYKNLRDMIALDEDELLPVAQARRLKSESRARRRHGDRPGLDAWYDG